MAKNNLAGKILKGMDSFVDGAQWGGKAILRSNEPINKIGKFVMGEADTGIRGTLRGLSHGKGLGASVKSAYTHRPVVDGVKGARQLNYKAVAGTYVGAAAAGRVLTGGGIYRDSTGSTNVPIVPFI